ncbi:MAG: hypothetical protein ACR2IE_16655 [Candidatus Sumerlaeaceae bacterium]
MKVLFIEDDPPAVEPAQRRFEKSGAICTICNFDEAQQRINETSPDVVILDWFRGAPAEGETAGAEVFNFIWNQRFCPLVVYSAEANLAEEGRERHPFVNYVRKGRGSVDALEQCVAGFQGHIESIRDAEKEVSRQFAIALKVVAPHAFAHVQSADERREIIVRAGRRRLAALMDELSLEGEPLKSWEHYLVPPVSEDLQLGDLLRLNSSKDDDPTAFRLVLTPSCDTATSGKRKPKVACILTAQCCTMQQGLASVGLGETGDKKLRERLQCEILTHGHFQAMIPFPKFAGVIPTMAASLRDLELISLDMIGEGKEYRRVAAVDSPFREHIAWAYLQTACRPALPDRDLVNWCEEILSANKKVEQQ